MSRIFTCCFNRVFASITIYHDTRRKNDKMLYPIKLGVYYRGETRLYPTGINISDTDFNPSYLSAKPKGEYHKNLKLKILSLEAKAN